MTSELAKAKKKYEESIIKQLNKFEIVETKLQKKNEKYKKEIKDQEQLYKTIIDQLKLKNSDH